MLNDGHGSEERISVPSCYGGIGAPVSKQGESRGLKGSGFPAAGERPREGVRPRKAWHLSCLLCLRQLLPPLADCSHVPVAPKPVQGLVWHKATWVLPLAQAVWPN